MGQIMHRLLDTLEIPWDRFPDEESEIESAIAKADATMQETQRPYALVMSQGAVAAHALGERPQPRRVKTELLPVDESDSSQRVTRTEALELILESLSGDEAIVATTGKTGRELFTLADRPNHIYVVGGMGTASAIGLGIAHALPRQKVVVIDGDGAALMKLGCLATVGYYQPANLLHIILDNEQHDSTGGQQTASPTVRFADVAAATNYRRAFTATGRHSLAHGLRELRGRDGPSLLHAKIQPGSPPQLGRPTVKPHEVKARFMEFLQDGPSMA
jgi:phosphonopyruvate decarboxylase